MTATLPPPLPTIERNDPRIETVPGPGKPRDLHEACAVGDLAAVGRHLARGASPSARSAAGFTPLQLASFGGHLAVARAVLAAGARVDDRSCHDGGCTGATALHLAVAAGHAELAAALLAAGADPELRDDAGYTPLHLAAERGDAALVKLLARRRVALDPRVGDCTALDLARRGRHHGVLALLRQLGAR